RRVTRRSRTALCAHAPRLSPPPYKPQSVPHASTHSLSLPRTGQPVSEAIPSPVLEPSTSASSNTDAANRARPDGPCHNVARDYTVACDHAPTPDPPPPPPAAQRTRQTPSLGPPCAHSRPRLNS
ncbi:conserved hypothetical protein, partial [Ixodes scapularis]